MSDLPYPEDRGKTHYAGCWKERGHHNCAVAEIEVLEKLRKDDADEIERLLAEWRIQNECIADQHDELRKLRAAYHTYRNAVQQAYEPGCECATCALVRGEALETDDAD